MILFMGCASLKMWDKGKGKGDKDWEHSAQNSKLFFTAEWKAGKQGQTDHEKAPKKEMH